MNENVKKQLDILAKRYPDLSMIVGEIENTYLILEECYCNGGKLLVAGNGGSAADSEHIVGELMKGFENPRKLSDEYKDKLIAIDDQMGAILANNLQMALPAIALDGHVALTTAYMNDCEPLLCFAQQINGYGRENDVFLGISDVTIKAPQSRTYMIQEYHLPIYHCLCLMLEERFFGETE